jgi:hypothetical protein
MGIEDKEGGSILSPEKKREMKYAIDSAYAAFMLQEKEDLRPIQAFPEGGEKLEKEIDRIWEFVRSYLLKKGYTLVAENELRQEFAEELRQRWNNFTEQEKEIEKQRR